MASRQETFNDYDGFVEKFKPKKTTDDCYTPKEVYDVILEWAVERYGIDPARAVFIDDTLANVEGAMKFGMHGFHMHESGMMDRFFL